MVNPNPNPNPNPTPTPNPHPHPHPNSNPDPNPHQVALAVESHPAAKSVVARKMLRRLKVHGLLTLTGTLYRTQPLLSP